MTSKSVSTTLDGKDYDALKALAKEEDRDISGQVRHMLRAALRNSQTHPGEYQPDSSEDGGAGAKGFLPDTSPDSTLGETERAKQEPLPG